MTTKFEDLPEADRLTLWLAEAALTAWMGDAHETALTAVQRIHDECGADALDLTLCAWADWMARALGIRQTPGASVRLKFLGFDTDGAATGVTDVEGVSRPEIAWAGRLIAARVAMDQEQHRALIAALPGDDPAAVGRHVVAVLETCAVTMCRFGRTP